VGETVKKTLISAQPPTHVWLTPKHTH